MMQVSLIMILWTIIVQSYSQICTCDQSIQGVCTINSNCTYNFTIDQDYFQLFKGYSNLSITNSEISICFEKVAKLGMISLNTSIEIYKSTIKHNDLCWATTGPNLTFLAPNISISYSYINLSTTVSFQGADLLLTNSTIKGNMLSACFKNNAIFINSTFEAKKQNKSSCSCLNNERCVKNTTETTQLYSYFEYITKSYTKLDAETIQQQWYAQFQCSNFELKNLTYFTIVLAGNNSLQLYDSKIKGFYIGIYSNILNDQNSQIVSDGMGYYINEGYGCGYTDKIIGLRQQCGGTGGSHGGAGGFSISPKSHYNQLCLQLKSKEIYDSSFNPMLPGSGGGGVTYGQLADDINPQGQGGGVIYIESRNLQNDGIISSNGSQYLAQPFFGSGSGGSIWIKVLYINGTGFITAVGGGSDATQFVNTNYQYMKERLYQSYSAYGGFGGGGRIRFVFLNIENFINIRKTVNYTNSTVLATAGSASMEQMQVLQANNYSTINYHGSIISSSCPQGTRGFFCHYCPLGKYKYLYGQAKCQPCLNELNENSNYSQTGEIIPFCQIVCNSGSLMEGECLTGLGEFSERLGGQNSIFALFVVIILLLINIAIIWVNKETREKKQRQFYGSYDESSYQQYSTTLNELNNKTYLVGQDLPFHMKRVYIGGRNLYCDPWQIYHETLQEFKEEENEQFKNLIENFNIKAKYRTWERVLLLIFKFYYYPFYLWILQLRQNSKFKLLSKLFERQDHIFQSKYRVKFSCSKDRSLGSLDKLDQQINMLEQSNTLDLPISLVLCGYGTFQFPYQININDALIKRLWQQFRKYSPENDEENFNLFEKFVATFNYFAVKIDYRQSRSSFIKRFSDLLIYTNESNKEIFGSISANNEKLWVDICIHLIHDDGGKSQVIQIGQPNQRDFEELLSKIHYLQNFTTDFVIKVSVIFDYYRKERIINLLTFQNNVPCNINLQLQLVTSGDHQENKNFIQIEKTKMLSKINRNKLEVKEYEKRGHLIFKRGFTWLFSQITRYRDNSINSQLLIAGICILLAIQWVFKASIKVFVIAYPVILYIVYDNQKYTGKYQVFEAEFFTQIFVFPFAQIISLALLSAWLLKSRRNYGKMYLLFNLCALASSFIEFLYGCYDLFNFSSQAEFNLFKLFPFFFILLSSHLVCLQTHKNEQNKMKYFEN